MNKEQAINYLRSSGMSDEQIETVAEAFREPGYVSTHEIANAPSVRPQEPKTGHWIFKKFDEKSGISNSYWCSVCNHPMSQVYINYCGYCGAHND